MSIHTIGDSHSVHGWKKMINHHIGPVLCYNFGKDKLNRCDIRTLPIKDGDTIVFCFGEIDCRCHVHKHVTESFTYQEVIQTIVDNYFDAIDLNLTTSQLQLKHVCVYNVVPPIQKYNTWENPEYPYLGTDDERKQYVLFFNQQLQKKCIEKGYVFFDIYNHYTDENGFLRKDLSDGNVHILIDNDTYIQQFIKENGL
jgi:hypothetical protein